MQSLKFWKNKRFKNFREFFWPILEPLNEEDAKPQLEFVLQIEEENIDTVLNLAKKISETEEDRRKGIETKAALFLSTISIATTLVVASNTMMNSKFENGLAINISLVISFLLSLYTIRTVWFSVKALERGNYHVLGFKDINVKGNEKEYKKNLIITIATQTRANYSTVDEKVDNLSMAQAYYKRAIVVISLYALWVVCFALFLKKNSQEQSQQPNCKSITIINQYETANKNNLKQLPDTIKTGQQRPVK